MRSTAIEDIVISHIVQSKDMSILERNGITSRDFKGNAKKVLEYIEHHVEEYGEVPSESTVIYEMGDSYSSVQVTESPLYLENSLQAHISYNALYDSILKQQDKLTTGSPKEVQEAIQDIVTVADEGLRRAKPKSTGVDLTKSRDRIEEYSERIRGEGEPTLYLNMPTLDESLGGILSDDLLVVYARPGVGKSYTLTYMASQLHKQGLNVLFYSGEMEESQVGYRFDSMRAHVSNKALISGTPFPRESADYQAYTSYLEELSEAENFFRIVTPRNDFNGSLPTTKDIEALIDELQPDVVFIDQLSLMKDHSRAREKREQFTNIMRDLRTMSGVKRIPIFVASQANRQSAVKNDQGEFDIPEVEHLAESDAVGQYATRVIGIASKRTEDRNVQILKLGVKKNRHSFHTEFEMMVNFDLGHVDELVTEDGNEVSEREVPF